MGRPCGAAHRSFCAACRRPIAPPRAVPPGARLGGGPARLSAERWRAVRGWRRAAARVGPRGPTDTSRRAPVRRTPRAVARHTMHQVAGRIGLIGIVGARLRRLPGSRLPSPRWSPPPVCGSGLPSHRCRTPPGCPDCGPSHRRRAPPVCWAPGPPSARHRTSRLAALACLPKGDRRATSVAQRGRGPRLRCQSLAHLLRIESGWGH
jgi:hypothetical protein